jgi:hypothetical protein
MRRHVLIALVATLALVVAVPGAAGNPAVAHLAKKCKAKHGTKHGKRCKKTVPPVVTPPAPVPPALTAQEVISRVVLKAQQYCGLDPFCFDYGYYYDASPGDPYCVSRTTYSWVCDGWKDVDYGENGLEECEFREVVERVGFNGIDSHQDPSYVWHCAPLN